MRRTLLPVIVLWVVALAVLAPTAVAATAQDDDYTLKVLVRGAPLHEANGIWADDQGRLFVATAAGGEIAVLDALTGHVLDRYTRAEGFGSADDVTMGPDGSLYWTDIFEGKVGRLAPDGAISWQSVAPGVNPITFSSDGRLFVAQAIMPVGDALWELDPALEDPPKLVWQPGDVYPFAEQLNGFDFGPDGMLYAPQPYLGRVVCLDLTQTPVVPKVIAEGLSFPTAVKFDSQGRLFAVQSSPSEVVRIDVASGSITTVAAVPTGESGLDNLAFGPADRLYATGGGDGSVWRILPSGVARNLSRSGMGTPGGIAVMPEASRRSAPSLYVADTFSLWRFDARTGRVRDTEWSFWTNEFTMPFSVAPYGDDLIMTSWFMQNVQIWDPETSTILATWSGLGVPLDAICFQDWVVLATFAPGGTLLRLDASGAPSVLAEGLYVPSGLAASDDDLWVADWASGVVWQVVADGVVLPALRPVAFGLARPEGLALDRDGSLLVVEEGAGRLTRVDPATGATSTVASGLRVGIPATPSGVPFWALSGVAVDARGNIYVTGDEGSVVYRLKRIR